MLKPLIHYDFVLATLILKIDMLKARRIYCTDGFYFLKPHLYKITNKNQVWETTKNKIKRIFIISSSSYYIKYLRQMPTVYSNKNKLILKIFNNKHFLPELHENQLM